MTYALGRVVEHDPRSRQAQFAAAQAPLRTVSHRNWQKHPMDQLDLGSCTGHAMAQALNTTPLRHGRPLLTHEDAVKLYSRATVLDGFPGQWPPDDTGSSGLAVAKAAKDAGYITAYHHAFGIDQALRALVLSPILIGIGWTESMFEVDGNGYIHPEGDDVGGHEIIGIAEDVKRQDIVILNQWYNSDGTPWGRNGRARMTFEAFDERLRNRGDVTVAVL